MVYSTTSIKPLGTRILLKLGKDADKNPGGIAIPDSAKNKGIEGTIIAIGDGTGDDAWSEQWPGPFVEGMQVLVGKWAGQDVEIYDTRETLLLVWVSEIIAILIPHPELPLSTPGSTKAR